MKLLALSMIASVACTDAVVELSLVLPGPANTLVDTTCVTSVELRAIGPDFARDATNYQSACIDVTGGTYSDLERAMRGRYSLAVPPNGLAGVQIYGWSGMDTCQAPEYGSSKPDLIFVGSAPYIGQDLVELGLVPHVSCARSTVNVHVTDILGMLAGPEPSDANCETATVAPSNQNVWLGSLVLEPFQRTVVYHGKHNGTTWTDNRATFTGLARGGASGCIALDGDNATGMSKGCAVPGPTLCPGAAHPDELEVAAVAEAVYNDTVARAPKPMIDQFPGLVFGTVWSGGAPQRPLAGATVAVDPAQGVVVYVDPPAPGSAQLAIRAQPTTGPSGLFVLYTNAFPKVRVSAPGKAPRELVLSATSSRPAGAIVVLP